MKPTYGSHKPRRDGHAGAGKEVRMVRDGDRGKVLPGERIRRGYILEAGLSPGMLVRFFEEGSSQAVHLRVQPQGTGPQAKEYADLPHRQKEVLGWTVLGLSLKEMAGEMGISVKTVEYHRGKLSYNLHLHSPVELVKWTKAKGIYSYLSLCPPSLCTP